MTSANYTTLLWRKRISHSRHYEKLKRYFVRGNIIQLSLFDYQPPKPTHQLRIQREDDGCYTLLHSMSGRIVCCFGILTTKKDAERMRELLEGAVDLDGWYRRGLPESERTAITLRVTEAVKVWQYEMGITAR